MIQPTILSSASSGFSAVDYNEQKVKEGQAELLQAHNMQFAHDRKSFRDYLQLVSSLNHRVEKPQFHAVISTKGKENSMEQLQATVGPFMKEMGYGDQPYLVYAHRDTDNNHLHIVSTRVDLDGKKINDSFEKIRSQKAMHLVLGHSKEFKAEKELNRVVSDYQYSTFGQFKAIAESKGYLVDLDKSKERFDVVKFGGKVLENNEVSGLEDQYNKYPERSGAYLTNQFKEYLESAAKKSHTYEQLVEVLKEKNKDLVLYRSEKHDQPYGYTLIDHDRKVAFAGSSLVKIKELNAHVASTVNRRYKGAESPKDVKELLSYKVSSERELRDVFRNAGYRIDKGAVYNGDKKVVSKEVLHASVNATRQDQLAIQEKYASVIKKFIRENGLNRSLSDLKESLQRNQSMDMVFHRDRSGNLRNYSVIDHQKRMVFSSDHLVKPEHLSALSNYAVREEKLQKMLSSMKGFEARVSKEDFKGYLSESTGMDMVSHKGQLYAYDEASGNAYTLPNELGSSVSASVDSQISLPALAQGAGSVVLDTFLDSMGAASAAAQEEEQALKKPKKKKRKRNRGYGMGY